ncbi:hypothetical protein Drorol1_Dr00012656, partial [Drosera rotundifolia]
MTKVWVSTLSCAWESKGFLYTRRQSVNSKSRSRLTYKNGRRTEKDTAAMKMMEAAAAEEEEEEERVEWWSCLSEGI